MADSSNFSDNSNLTIVVVASHAIIRQALRLQLENTYSAISVIEAESPDRTIEVIKNLVSPTIIIVPDAHGIISPKLLKQLRAVSQSARIAVVGLPGKALDEAELTVSQNMNWDQFIAALETGGKSAASAELPSKPMRRRIVSPGTPDALTSLSSREREVFYLLANGVPNRIIAKQLFVSPRTIETHRARVIRKLGLSSTASIVRYAIRHNLLSA